MATRKLETGSVVARLRTVYGQKAALDRRDSVISSNVYRPVSFYASVPFVRLGWSPNQVTVLGVIVAVAGAFMLATGIYSLVVVGSVLCAIQTILDYVDGNIARLRGTSSHLGKFIDGVADTAVHVMIAVAIGIGLFRGSDAFVDGRAMEVRAGVLLLGALTALVITLQAWLVFRLRAAAYEAGFPVRSPVQAETPGRQGNRWIRVGQWIDDVLRFEAFAMLVGIVFFALVNLLSLFLLIRFCARTAALAVEIARTALIATSRLDSARDV